MSLWRTGLQIFQGLAGLGDSANINARSDEGRRRLGEAGHQANVVGSNLAGVWNADQKGINDSAYTNQANILNTWANSYFGRPQGAPVQPGVQGRFMGSPTSEMVGTGMTDAGTLGGGPISDWHPGNKARRDPNAPPSPAQQQQLAREQLLGTMQGIKLGEGGATEFARQTSDQATREGMAGWDEAKRVADQTLETATKDAENSRAFALSQLDKGIAELGDYAARTAQNLTTPIHNQATQTIAQIAASARGGADRSVTALKMGQVAFDAANQASDVAFKSASEFATKKAEFRGSAMNTIASLDAANTQIKEQAGYARGQIYGDAAKAGQDFAFAKANAIFQGFTSDAAALDRLTTAAGELEANWSANESQRVSALHGALQAAWSEELSANRDVALSLINFASTYSPYSKVFQDMFNNQMQSKGAEQQDAAIAAQRRGQSLGFASAFVPKFGASVSHEV